MFNKYYFISGTFLRNNERKFIQTVCKVNGVLDLEQVSKMLQKHFDSERVIILNFKRISKKMWKVNLSKDVILSNNEDSDNVFYDKPTLDEIIERYPYILEKLAKDRAEDDLGWKQ